MKLAMMPGDTLAPDEVRKEGFEAVQMFFGGGADGDGKDPSAADVDGVLLAADIALAAMTLHVDLVGAKGAIAGDVERLVRCVNFSSSRRSPASAALRLLSFIRHCSRRPGGSSAMSDSRCWRWH